jgi:hypothetical protein
MVPVPTITLALAVRGVVGIETASGVITTGGIIGGNGSVCGSDDDVVGGVDYGTGTGGGMTSVTKVVMP